MPEVGLVPLHADSSQSTDYHAVRACFSLNDECAGRDRVAVRKEPQRFARRLDDADAGWKPSNRVLKACAVRRLPIKATAVLIHNQAERVVRRNCVRARP